jgi:hypothetical protein
MIMRLALLTGVAAALSFVGAAGAQAETIYATDSTVVADPYDVSAPNVIATTPGHVIAVPAPPFGPFTPQYIVTQPTIVVAPPAAAPERVIERERVVVAPRGRVAGPRERVIERERVTVAPREQVVVAPREREIVTTGSARSSCFIDRNGFERCY